MQTDSRDPCAYWGRIHLWTQLPYAIGNAGNAVYHSLSVAWPLAKHYNVSVIPESNVWEKKMRTNFILSLPMWIKFGEWEAKTLSYRMHIIVLQFFNFYLLNFAISLTWQYYNIHTSLQYLWTIRQKHTTLADCLQNFLSKDERNAESTDCCRSLEKLALLMDTQHW